ncbi:hypothetical protein [Streptomyces sp. NPDC046685]|uniref:hypothetical protein n=1 Tax=Streptomyces sp. NPDC046685 TaxID=3157202 RepID=UPI003410B599
MPGTIAPVRERTSRTPTGLPNPPLILLAGPEKSGKSYEAVLGSGSDLVGMTYWISIGGTESTADYYGRVKGARYEIVEHDGSYQDILDAIRWAIAKPPVNGKRNMIVLDSVTALWDLLSDEQALFARRRAERKAQENRRRAPGLDDPVVVDSDLWNRAKDRWGEVLWLLRRHSGPALLLARQEIVTAFENDKPTRHTTRKIKAEKNLPAAVDAIVELHTLGEAYVTGVRTLHWDIKPGETVPFPKFAVDTLLRRLGYEDAVAQRSAIEVQPAAYLHEQRVETERSVPAADQRAPSAEQLTGARAAELIGKAVVDKVNPEACLQGIREEWGIRTLAAITTRTKWGQMSADDLITRSLAYVKERERAKENADAGNQPGAEGSGPTTGAPSVPPVGEAPVGGDHLATSAEPPGDGEAPPPPDPQAEESSGENPEEVSAAEEPQDLPPAVPRRRRRNKAEEIAYKALMEEADAQARCLFLTVGEHLAPISEDGEPSLSVLRDHLREHRPTVAAALDEAGETDLANAYRAAPIPDLSIAKQFARVLDTGTPLPRSAAPDLAASAASRGL